MAMFEIEANGKRYQVEAPDIDSAVKALGGQAPSATPAPSLVDVAGAARDAMPSTTEDVLKGGGSGLVEGGYGLVGLPGDAVDLTRAAGGWLGNRAREFMGKKAVEGPAPDPLGISSIPGTRDLMEATGFKPYEPQTTAGKYARTVGQFVPAAATFGATGGVRGALTAASKYGVVPGLTSEAAGQLTEGTAAEPYARMAGAVAGGVVPSMSRRAVTPLPAAPERQRAVNALRQEGVTDLTAGQTTGSQKLRYMESELGGVRAEGIMENQAEQFTRAALRRAGIDAARATPEVVDNAFQRIGQQFDDLSRNNAMVPDRGFVNDLRDALQWYAGRVSPPNRAPIIADYATEIANVAQRGNIPGEVYQSLRSRIARDARGAGDQYIAQTLRELENTLDDAMERSIAAFNPADLGGWREARRQYRNILVIEKAATGAGENAALGLLSPSQLRNATVQQGRRAYARGQGDFAELARSGEAVMKSLPQSGTSPRHAARNIIAGIPAILGASAGSSVGGIGGGVLGGVIGAAAPFAAGRAILSAPGRRYLGNQLLPRPAPRRGVATATAITNSTLPLRLAPPPR